MKKLKISRKYQLIAVFTILLVVIAALATSSANARNRINGLEIDNAVNASEIAKMKLELQSLKIGNGTSLDQCLDEAAKSYSAKLKSDSELNTASGSPIYTQSMQSWNEANAKLESDRKSCNSRFN